MESFHRFGRSHTSVSSSMDSLLADRLALTWWHLQIMHGMIWNRGFKCWLQNFQNLKFIRNYCTGYHHNEWEYEAVFPDGYKWGQEFRKRVTWPPSFSSTTWSKCSNHQSSEAFFVDGTKLERKLEMKDLEMIFDTKVSFNEHIDHMTARALGFLERNRREMSEIYALLFTAAMFGQFWNTQVLFGTRIMTCTIRGLNPFRNSFYCLHWERNRRSNLPSYSSIWLVDLESLTGWTKAPQWRSILKLNEQ